MIDIGGLIKYVREEPSLHLSPVLRQVLVNRLSFEPTEREIERARDQVMGRATASAN
jgi:hypothetical protein